MQNPPLGDFARSAPASTAPSLGRSSRQKNSRHSGCSRSNEASSLGSDCLMAGRSTRPQSARCGRLGARLQHATTTPHEPQHLESTFPRKHDVHLASLRLPVVARVANATCSKLAASGHNTCSKTRLPMKIPVIRFQMFCHAVRKTTAPPHPAGGGAGNGSPQTQKRRGPGMPSRATGLLDW